MATHTYNPITRQHVFTPSGNPDDLKNLVAAAGGKVMFGGVELNERTETPTGDGALCAREGESMDTVIYFTNCKPSAYDSLGEIRWRVVNPHCKHCGRDLAGDDVVLAIRIYDGFHWEDPTCAFCNFVLQGEPVDPAEREIIRKRRGEMDADEPTSAGVFADVNGGE